MVKSRVTFNLLLNLNPLWTVCPLSVMCTQDRLLPPAPALWYNTGNWCVLINSSLSAFLGSNRSSYDSQPVFFTGVQPTRCSREIGSTKDRDFPRVLGKRGSQVEPGVWHASGLEFSWPRHRNFLQDPDDALESTSKARLNQRAWTTGLEESS